MGDDVVFPGAGYIAMAMEAIYQMQTSLAEQRGESFDSSKWFRLRDVRFPKALVLEEKKDHKIQIALSAKGTWHEFIVSSLSGEVWDSHSHGLIRFESEIDSCGYKFSSKFKCMRD